MTSLTRATDKLELVNFNRTERIFTDGMNYYYKIRDSGVSTAFETYTSAYYDLQNFILAVSIQNELCEECNNFIINDKERVKHFDTGYI